MIKTIIGDKPAQDTFIKAVVDRNNEQNDQVDNIVKEIVQNVKQNGDSAVLEYCRKFDGATRENFELSKEEIKSAYEKCDKKLIEILKRSAANIEAYHQKQKRQGFNIDLAKNSKIGQVIRPLDKAGIYVPGGTAAYPSSVLMNAIPAKIAGVSEIIMVTPPKKNGEINCDVIAAAVISGVDRIFMLGGAQAVAALAFGTETVPKVDKITGPGNIYVAQAKKQVFGKVDIDMIAGPSEILIIADETANEKFIAADMLSQAEHDVLASSILLTTSLALAEKVTKEIEKQLKLLERCEIAKSAIDNFGAIIVCDSIDRCIELSNILAPEHLEIITKNYQEDFKNIKNAGSVFLGAYSPEPLGDYYAGPNHVLPTSGTARFSSPLSVDDFYKKLSYINYSKELLSDAKDDIEFFAEHEGLTAHANSVRVRFYDK